MATGIKNLSQILRTLTPTLASEQYVYCTIPVSREVDVNALKPLATIREDEGLTLILALETAKKYGFPYQGPYRCITLKVHSSLEAVGLTAAVSHALAHHQIPANMLAGYFHDHILLPDAKAESAMAILAKLSS